MPAGGEFALAAAALRSMAEAVALARASDRTFVLTNPAFEDLLGYRPGELLGRSVDQVDPAFAPDAPWRGEVRHTRVDGSEVWSQASVTGHVDPDEGQLWITVLADATDRRKADDDRDAILRAVSHDLRNPLVVIEGFAAALARPDVSLAIDDVRTLAQRVVDAARRMRRQLNDLLDVDRLSRRVIEVQRSPVDLRDLAVTTVEALHLDDRVDVVGAPLVADVDVAQVERILDNLLANAVRHAPSAHIWVHVEPPGDGEHDGGVLLRVDDDGPGVEPELRERIFDVFESGAADTGGTGIGLSLVRRFAELHGGRAWVEERPGGGASFRVRLPGTSHGAGGGR